MSDFCTQRIGEVKKVVLRNQVILPDGYIRNSVFYHILDSEWPAVKKRLEKIMRK